MSEKDTEILSLTVGADSVRALGAPGSRMLSLPLVQKLVCLSGDLLALFLAHMVSVRLVRHLLELPVDVQNPIHYHRYYLPFFAAILYLFENYRSPELRRPEKELEIACKAVSCAFVGLMVLNFLVFKQEPVSRYLIVTWFALSCVFLLITRSLVRTAYTRLWRLGLAQRTAVLMGSPSSVSGFQQLLSIQRYNGYKVLGLISEEPGDNPTSVDLPDLAVLGPIVDWQRIVSSLKPDIVILTLPSCPDVGDSLEGILRKSGEMGVKVELYSPALANSKLSFERDEFAGCLRFYSRPKWSTALQYLLKNAFDLTVGVIGSLVTLLLIPVIGFLIKLHDGGPIFYRSAYLGEDRRNHYYLKFRTMRVDADEVLQRDPELKSQFSTRQKLMEDPRVTPLGRFLRKSSLDEFPQFFSLLTGQLSFVGPRTIRQEEGYRYGTLLPRLLSVKPGMTGFWQVMGRQTTTYEERVQMDLFYIEHWSIWLDLFLAAKTFWKVFKCEGAY